MAAYNTVSIKPGTTAAIRVQPAAVLDRIDSIIFRFVDRLSGYERLTARYPDDTAVNDAGDILIGLTQQDTMTLCADASIEAQYNMKSGQVSKGVIGVIKSEKTLRTTIIDTAGSITRKQLAQNYHKGGYPVMQISTKTGGAV